MAINKEKFNRKYGFEKGSGHSIAEISRKTGVSTSILNEVKNRGRGARKSNPQSVRRASDGKKVGGKSLEGKISADEVVFAGIPYTFKYQFSEPVVKQNNQPITTADLRIRNWSVVYNDTGFFTIKTTPNRRSTYTRNFTGRIVGGAANLLNKAAIDRGTYVFGVIGNADTKIELSSDNHLPCKFQSAEWEGFYVLRSRRM